MRISILTLAVLALLTTVSVLHADDATPAADAKPEAAQPADEAPAAQEAPAPAAETPAAKPKLGPNHVAFQQNFEQWKKLLTKLHTLRQQYVSASDAEKKELEEQYMKLVEEAVALQPKLTESAEKAYIEDPKADPQLEEFMEMACADNFQIDNFEESYRLGKMLMDHGCKVPQIKLIAGASAYCIGQLDEAETLLKELAKQGQSLETKKDTVDSLINMFLNEPSTYKKAWAKEQEIRAKEAEANDLPRVKLKTDKGDIVVELFENEAPIATANFISLVEKGFYDGLGFHRVLKGFMAQGGCPDGTGAGGPGYNIPCECYKPEARKHFRGSLSMAHAGRDTGGSQFFLTFVPTTFLDGRHTAFGRVVEGIDVLANIRERDPSNPKAMLPPPDKIIKAEVIRKRDHEYKPTKVGE